MPSSPAPRHGRTDRALKSCRRTATGVVVRPRRVQRQRARGHCADARYGLAADRHRARHDERDLLELFEPPQERARSVMMIFRSEGAELFEPPRSDDLQERRSRTLRTAPR